MINEAQFPGDPRSVVSARRFVADSLSGIPIEVSEAAALIASELASNSVRHAASAFEVRVEQLPHQIHIEVADDGSGMPEVKAPQPDETSGRGLQIVTALADEWGVVPNPQSTGKTVWVKIAVQTAGDAVRASHSDETPASRPSQRKGRKTGAPGAPPTSCGPVTALDPALRSRLSCGDLARPSSRRRSPVRCRDRRTAASA